MFTSLHWLSFWLGFLESPTLICSLVVRYAASLLSQLFYWFLISMTFWLVYTGSKPRSWPLISAFSIQTIESWLGLYSQLYSRKCFLAENQNMCGDPLWIVFFFSSITNIYCLFSILRYLLHVCYLLLFRIEGKSSTNNSEHSTMWTSNLSGFLCKCLRLIMSILSTWKSLTVLNTVMLCVF